MRIGCIIQARLGSTRFPGKVMKTILKRPLLGLLIERLIPSNYISEIVVATTTNKKDKKIVEWCINEEIPVFVGSEEDVLDRYYQCAKEYKFDIIIRSTADNITILTIFTIKTLTFTCR